MALSPALITRSVMVLETKKNKELVSCSFIARFNNGTEKVLNSKNWQSIGLLRASDIGEVALSINECSLYFKDWYKNPVLGTMKNNMPPTLMPGAITSLFTPIKL